MVRDPEVPFRYLMTNLQKSQLLLNMHVVEIVATSIMEHIIPFI